MTDLRARVSPELVAAAIVVVAATVIGLSSAGANGVTGVSPSPSVSPSTTPPRPTEGPDEARVRLLLEFDRRISETGAGLRAEAEAADFDVVAVVVQIRQLTQEVRPAVDAARPLLQRRSSESAGRAAIAYYERILDRANAALEFSLTNEPAYRRAADEILAILQGGSQVDSALLALLVGPGGSTSPPPPSASPSSSAPPSPGSSPGQLVANGGFETTLDPWQLVLRDDAADATIALDSTTSHRGVTSARVGIISGSDSRSGIAVRQAGIQLEPGKRYAYRIALRAAGARDVRLTVVDLTGAAYATRLFAIGDEWTEFSFEFTAVVADPDAAFEVDLGRSGVSVWLDEASLRSASDPNQ